MANLAIISANRIVQISVEGETRTTKTGASEEQEKKEREKRQTDERVASYRIALPMAIFCHLAAISLNACHSLRAVLQSLCYFSSL